MVKPKKHLGQHFITDFSVCEKISEAITFHESYNKLLEVGPGTGAVTQYLLKLDATLKVAEVDRESIKYLNEHYPDLEVLDLDILKADLDELYNDQFGIVGNFPYHISTQIMFTVLQYKHVIPEVVGMFQKEVAQRICEPPGKKTYGILSVLIQAFYEAEYLYTIGPEVFDPPPKIDSGILRLRRRTNFKLDCDEKLFFQIVKMAFNQRRKTISNSLAAYNVRACLTPELLKDRPEQLNVEQFVTITNLISNSQE